MRVMISVLTGAAAMAAIAGTLPAQQKQPAPEKREAPRTTMCYSTDPGRTECEKMMRSGMDSAMMKRAALGLQLSATGTSRDTLGVFVTRVTPKGPAENAGIVEGDRIVSINGVDLRVTAADAGDDYASELPVRRLTREVQKLTPGSVASLRVYSGGRIRDVRVTAARAADLGDRNFFGAMMDGGPGGFTIRSLPRMNMEELGPMTESLPRIRMEELNRMRLEDLPELRERLRELPLRLRELNMEPMRTRLHEGNYRMLAPSRVRVLGPDGEVIIYNDSVSTLKAAKSKADQDRSAKEKARKDKVTK